MQVRAVFCCAAHIAVRQFCTISTAGGEFVERQSDERQLTPAPQRPRLLPPDAPDRGRWYDSWMNASRQQTSLDERPGGWLPTLHEATVRMAVALSPSTYTPALRHAVAARICRMTAQLVPRFVLLAGLLSVVIVHIVVVTAQSYGLSQFALSTVIRVLVVELLPLTAALYVALRGGPLDGSDTAPPAVIARSFLVVLLVAVSGLIALTVAYIAVYGLTPWGLGVFTRTVGHVFDPIVLSALGLKTALFAASVATLSGTVRLFGVLIAIETLVLAAEFI